MPFFVNDDLLSKQAALNVGGIVLNALAIEHFILRYPNELKHVCEICVSYKVHIIPSFL